MSIDLSSGRACLLLALVGSLVGCARTNGGSRRLILLHGFSTNLSSVSYVVYDDGPACPLGFAERLIVYYELSPRSVR